LEGVSEKETRRRILIVDDDPGTGATVRSWFRGRPFDVLEARNGEEGLRLARTQLPDLILLDLRMPGADGIAVARDLREHPSTKHIPFVLLSAVRDTDAKIQAFQAGAEDYVEKPFKLEELEARMRTWLNRREMLRGLESQVASLNATKSELELALQLDDKTGLHNFREFQRRLKDEFLRAERYGTPLSLVFLDLDHFKAVNDTLGHQAGDIVLRQFATLVAGGARANDVAARYGGEEFAVILPHTDGEMAVRVAERIRHAASDFVFLAHEGTPRRITVSAGVATYDKNSPIDSVDGLIRAADSALYRAKDAGRNRVVRAGAGTFS
jgi:diguanylate cyclase (GGDEF)-like protein